MLTAEQIRQILRNSDGKTWFVAVVSTECLERIEGEYHNESEVAHLAEIKIEGDTLLEVEAAIDNTVEQHRLLITESDFVISTSSITKT